MTTPLAMAADKTNKATDKPVAVSKTDTKTTAAEKPAASDDTALASISPDTKKQLEALSASMHLQAKSIGNDLRDDEDVAATDIALLFQAAIERDDTIRMAINTLSHRDESGQPVKNDSTLKKAAGSALGLAGAAASMVTGNPMGVMAAATGQQALGGDDSDPYQHPVTDADMVILAREIDQLQTSVIEKYYHYRYAKERAQLATDSRQTMEKYMDEATKAEAAKTGDADVNAASMQTIMDTLADSAKQDEAKAQDDYVTARNGLVLLVGPNAVTAMEEAKQQIKDQQKPASAPASPKAADAKAS